MTNLATIQSILAVEKHPNADRLDVVQIQGFKCIVGRDQWKRGDLVAFVAPDSVLPVDRPWTAPYRARSSRVKAAKIRQIWSQGVVESLDVVGYTGVREPGRDITEDLGVIKYEAPTPQDLNVSGPFGYGIPKTDECRSEQLDYIPYGERVDVSLKIDGQSWTAFVKLEPEVDGPAFEMIQSFNVVRGVGGRSFLYKADSVNNYTRNEAQYGVLDKLEAFCRVNGVSLALRGESHGNGIQKGDHNPHSKLPLSLALYSTWLIDERCYARKGHPLYIFDLAPKLGLPTVPLLERDVVLTPELIRKYSEELETVDGKPFEGVVVQWAGGSFKIINLHFDQRKG